MSILKNDKNDEVKDTDKDVVVDTAESKDEKPKVDVDVQTVGTGPVLKPTAPTVKQGASFSIEVPFNPQLVDHNSVVQLVERAIRQYFEVINFKVGEVKDWQFKHLTEDEKNDNTIDDDDVVNSDTPAGNASANVNDNTKVSDAVAKDKA